MICCQIDRTTEARLDRRITNSIVHNFWRAFFGNRKNQRTMERQHGRYQNGFDFRNTNPHSDGTNYPWKYYDSVSDSDTSPQF